MRIKDIKTKEVQLVFDDTTFEIIEHDNTPLATTWTLWLKEGYDKIGIPVKEIPEDFVGEAEDPVKIFPQTSLGTFERLLLNMGLFID